MSYVKPFEVRRIMISLNTKIKTGGNIPTFVLKDYIDITLSYLTDIIRTSIYESKFPQSLTYADITFVFKKRVKQIM